MARDAVALLEDMFAEADYLRGVTSRESFEDFLEDPTLRRAVERSLEVRGEASKAVTADVRNRWPDLPWSEMARMRDLLIHAYHRVEPSIVWRTAQEDAAPLADLLQEALTGERSQ